MSMKEHMNVVSPDGTEDPTKTIGRCFIAYPISDGEHDLEIHETIGPEVSAVFATVKGCDGLAWARAERIVACVNACAALKDPSAVSDLLVICADLLRPSDTARAALARARGRGGGGMSVAANTPTPGPWSHDPAEGAPRPDWIRGPNGDIVAAVYFREDGSSLLPNARLIAAAPDLLAALQEVYDAWPRPRAGETYRDDDPGWFERAGAAIAKATGGEA